MELHVDQLIVRKDNSGSHLAFIAWRRITIILKQISLWKVSASVPYTSKYVAFGIRVAHLMVATVWPSGSYRTSRLMLMFAFRNPLCIFKAFGIDVYVI
ncbi:hypothetical protein Y032_0389g517 [Ancylostoma ceylanicum]|uniref:Uncharacterized protein n=1 Tax=Ancylostoma ceylanicum TaxID=53326 RepID=A0A016RSB9_9BILA|nr:hypothetical protein Y032_0389g517 [Ancylostoma ceylanicum]